MKYDKLTVYLGSTSQIKKDAVFFSLKNIFKKLYGKCIVMALDEIDFEDDIKYVLLTIIGEKIQTVIRSEPVSGKETISGSKLRAYELVKKYPRSWCVGVETGIVECHNYSNETNVSKGTVPHEMVDNPSALEHLSNFKDEGSYQLNLNHLCNATEETLKINALSRTDSYNVTAVTVVSPSRESITFLSNGVPLPFASDRMEEYDYLYHELERDGLDDIEKCMGSTLSDRSMSIVEPMMKAFAYLINLSRLDFLYKVQSFWTKERKNRYFKDTGKAVPDYHDLKTPSAITSTSSEFWLLLN